MISPVQEIIVAYQRMSHGDKCEFRPVACRYADRGQLGGIGTEALFDGDSARLHVAGVARAMKQ